MSQCSETGSSPALLSIALQTYQETYMKKAPPQAAKPSSRHGKGRVGSPSGAGTTASGPDQAPKPQNAVAEHGAEQQALAAAVAFNSNKALEYGSKNALRPPAGTS